jgi:membrane-associated PAP2 superfamily phosphatase
VHTSLITPRWWAITLGCAAALLAWDASPLDMALAQWFGTPTGFPLQFDPVLSGPLHSGARNVGWLVLLALAGLAIKPMGAWRALPRQDRWGLVLSVLACLAVISTLKAFSTTSCPWDLSLFGGSAQWISHWAWGVRDGGAGHCFPAGHASTGMAFIACYAWLKPASPRAARIALLLAVLTGLGLGWVQQMRGAHFMSHTLWSGWVCWVTGSVLWQVGHNRSKRVPA